MKIVNTPTLETDRLILRKFTEKDLEPLFLLLKDEEVNRFLPWFPVKSLDETRTFFCKRYAEVYSRERGYHYAICLQSDNIPIGYVKTDMDDGHDFGYALRKEFWHRGIVSEASKALAARLKADDVPYITATHDVNNPRSGKVMKAVGMKYRYSYREHWQPKGQWVVFRMYQLNFDGDENRVFRKYWDLYSDHFVENNI